MKLTPKELKIHHQICEKILEILNLPPYRKAEIMPILKKIREGKIDNLKITY